MNEEERLVELLKENGYFVTTIESCTGGMVASTIVSVQGASEVFTNGYITYSDKAKTSMVGVSEDIINKYGVVSIETAREMAQKGACTANANCSIATTGIAGPGGGSASTPVGTVCIACVINDKCISEKYLFEGNRAEIRMEAAKAAIRQLRIGIESERADNRV